MSLGVSAIGQGLLYGLIGLGLFLTFRVLDFPDMTVEGTFPFGAAVAVSAITHGFRRSLRHYLLPEQGCWRAWQQAY